LALRKLALAIGTLTKAYKLEPNSADVNHFLGEAYLQNKQGTLAIAHMRRAIEISPDGKADLHLRIAWLYNAAGAKDLAAAEYKLLLEKKPNHPDKQKLLQYIAENSR
jgi:tetratricopeptide (TPR) repeat protein